MALVRTIPICAMDFDPGPKIADGDDKTPEGIYHPDFSYQSANWWMWMDLDREKVGERGQVGKGSCFKMCIEYPNDLDPSNEATLGPPPASRRSSASCERGRSAPERFPASRTGRALARPTVPGGSFPEPQVKER